MNPGLLMHSIIFLWESPFHLSVVYKLMNTAVSVLAPKVTQPPFKFQLRWACPWWHQICATFGTWKHYFLGHPTPKYGFHNTEECIIFFSTVLLFPQKNIFCSTFLYALVAVCYLQMDFVVVHLASCSQLESQSELPSLPFLEGNSSVGEILMHSTNQGQAWRPNQPQHLQYFCQGRAHFWAQGKEVP